jgi:hypothetical protein
MILARSVLPAAILAVLVPSAWAQTSYPMLSRIEPTALQRGQAAEVTISGAGSFAGAWQLLCEGPGLSGEVLDAGNPSEAPPAMNKGQRRATGSVKARLSAGADAPLGPLEVRVATPQGLSSVGLVVVVADPVVAEADDKANDAAEHAQPIALPGVVAGAIAKAEDVDWYSFRATAGQRLTFLVWGNRLENKIHDLQVHFDPILLLHDERGRELAVDDNREFADPRLSFEVKETGTYRLQIRDTSYASNANWTYVLQATAGPVATTVTPMAVNPGGKAELHARGENFDTGQAIALEVPRDVPPGPWLSALPTAQGPTLPVPLVVTTLPVATESGDTSAGPEGAQALSLPVAMCGVLGVPNDIDGYRFEAKKGQIFAFEVVSRRAGSMADPVLRVVDDKGDVLAEADDAPGTKDPQLEWTAPADGFFIIRVGDLHSRGGADFGYVLQAEAARPDFAMTCDPDKVNVGPGARVPVFVQVARRAGFTGPVTIEVDGLPTGVAASPLTILPGMTQGVIVVSAKPDSKLAATLLTIRGRAQAADGELVRQAVPKQEIYVPGGGRGLYPVNTLGLAVTDHSDATVEATPSEIVLERGQTATIDVTVTRHAGYDKGVNLAIHLGHLGGTFANPLPPGVVVREAGSKTLLGPNETVGKIVLEAKPDAPPCDKVPIAVMGHVSINFVVKTAYASAPILVTVPPKGGPGGK